MSAKEKHEITAKEKQATRSGIEKVYIK